MTTPTPSIFPTPDPDPFRSYLLALLSIYEHGPIPVPLPLYDGPADWQTEVIIGGLNKLGGRTWDAEARIGAAKDIKKGEKNGNGSTPLRPAGSPSLPSTTTTNATNNINSFVHCCPTCGSLLGGTSPLPRIESTALPTGFPSDSPSPFSILHSYNANSDCPSSSSNPNTSSLEAPMALTAFESGLSAIEELKLLKAQLSDVARVCNAVARGDLSQEITAQVQGVVMVQLKDVVNTMVDSLKLGRLRELVVISQDDDGSAEG